MSRVYDVFYGVLLAAGLWVALDLSQSAWVDAVAILARSTDPAIPMVTLLVTGTALGLVTRFMSATTTLVAAGLLLLVLAPMALGLGSWWPDSFWGNPARLGIHAGTYLALGVLLSGTCIQAVEQKQRARSAAHEAAPGLH